MYRRSAHAIHMVMLFTVGGFLLSLPAPIQSLLYIHQSWQKRQILRLPNYLEQYSISSSCLHYFTITAADPAM